MRNERNMTELFEMISEAVIKVLVTEAEIVATVKNHVLANACIDTSRIEPCNHEEADTRLLLHVLDSSSQWRRRGQGTTFSSD